MSSYVVSDSLFLGPYVPYWCQNIRPILNTSKKNTIVLNEGRLKPAGIQHAQSPTLIDSGESEDITTRNVTLLQHTWVNYNSLTVK